MKITKAQTESLAWKLRQEAVKWEKKKIADFKRTSAIQRETKRVLKLIQQFPDDLGLQVTGIMLKTINEDKLSNLIAERRYTGAKAKQTRAIEAEITLLAPNCKSFQEIESKIVLMDSQTF